MQSSLRRTSCQLSCINTQHKFVLLLLFFQFSYKPHIGQTKTARKVYFILCLNIRICTQKPVLLHQNIKKETITTFKKRRGCDWRRQYLIEFLTCDQSKLVKMAGKACTTTGSVPRHLHSQLPVSDWSNSTKGVSNNCLKNEN